MWRNEYDIMLTMILENLNVMSSGLIYLQVNHPMMYATQKLISLANEMACYNQN